MIMLYRRLGFDAASRNSLPCEEKNKQADRAMQLMNTIRQRE